MWRVYYADGSTFSHRDGPPEAAPGLGVIVVVQHDPETGREMLHGDGPRVVDWFWWEDGAWLCGDMAGVVQYLATPGWKKILAGRNLPNARFREIMRRADSEPLA